MWNIVGTFLLSVLVMFMQTENKGRNGSPHTPAGSDTQKMVIQSSADTSNAIPPIESYAGTTGAVAPPETKAVGQNIYVVLAVTLIVWLGVFFFLLYLDHQLRQVKHRVEWQESKEKK